MSSSSQTSQSQSQSRPPTHGIQQPQRPPRSPLFSPRSLRQLTLHLAGSTFLGLSILTTRRALIKRRLSIYPAFYHPSNALPRVTINGRMEALEALSLATINAVSFMMMATGGALWASDISGLKELKESVRGGLGLDRLEMELQKEKEGDRVEGWEELEGWMETGEEGKRKRDIGEHKEEKEKK